MSWLSRLVNVFRSDRVGDELDEELAFHVDATADALIDQGVPPKEAARLARRRVGNAGALRERSRDVKLLPWLDALVRDVRIGSRALRRDALVSAAAIVSMALAIGACTAAFGLIDALILRRLPVADPDRLVYLAYANPEVAGQENTSFSYPLFQRFRDAAANRDSVALFSSQTRRSVDYADGSPTIEKPQVQFVSGNAFALLGVVPGGRPAPDHARRHDARRASRGRHQPRVLGGAVRRRPGRDRTVDDDRRAPVSDRGRHGEGIHRRRARHPHRRVAACVDVSPGACVYRRAVALVPRLGAAPARDRGARDARPVPGRSSRSFEPSSRTGSGPTNLPIASRVS